MAARRFSIPLNGIYLSISKHRIQGGQEADRIDVARVDWLEELHTLRALNGEDSRLSSGLTLSMQVHSTQNREGWPSLTHSKVSPHSGQPNRKCDTYRYLYSFLRLCWCMTRHVEV